MTTIPANPVKLRPVPRAIASPQSDRVSSPKFGADLQGDLSDFGLPQEIIDKVIRKAQLKESANNKANIGNILLGVSIIAKILMPPLIPVFLVGIFLPSMAMYAWSLVEHFRASRIKLPNGIPV